MQVTHKIKGLPIQEGIISTFIVGPFLPICLRLVRKNISRINPNIIPLSVIALHPKQKPEMERITDAMCNKLIMVQQSKLQIMHEMQLPKQHNLKKLYLHRTQLQLDNHCSG